MTIKENLAKIATLCTTHWINVMCRMSQCKEQAESLHKNVPLL